MSLDILKKQLKEKQIQNVYLFYGQEEYLKKYYLNAITELLVDENTKDLNFVIFDGKTDASTIMMNCDTLPVFSDRKVIVAKNSLLFKAKKGEDSGASKSGKDKFIEYIENMPDYSCLIFVESEIDKRIKLVNAIKKNGVIVEFDYQKPADLIKWVKKVFRSYKKNIDTMTASYIVENSEYAMTELLNEVEKVVQYTGDRVDITLEDVERVCTKTIKSRIFDLTDAVAEGNMSKALMLLNDMASLKEPMQKILFMIIRQIRLVYRMKLLRQQGIQGDVAAKHLGLTPYVATKVQNLSKNLDLNTLKNVMYYSLELDESIKTGKISDRVAIELIIASMGK